MLWLGLLIIATPLYLQRLIGTQSLGGKGVFGGPESLSGCRAQGAYCSTVACDDGFAACDDGEPCNEYLSREL